MAEIETRLFRYFVTLADERHFGHTAERLGITAPTLSHQIKSLEAQLGAELFVRRGNTRVELTDAGARFLQRARNVLHEAAGAAAVARQAARGEVGRIEFGFMAIALLMGLIEKFVRGFQAKHPGVEIVQRQMITADQINGVLGNTLDFGISRVPERYPSGLCGFPIARQAMVIALRADHPLAARNAIAPAALKDEAFVHYTPDIELAFWNQLEVLGKLGHFKPRVAIRIKDIMTILSYVAAGQGVAMVAESFVNITIPGVTFRQIATQSPPMMDLGFIHRQDEKSPAGNAFIDYMRGHAIA